MTKAQRKVIEQIKRDVLRKATPDQLAWVEAIVAKLAKK